MGPERRLTFTISQMTDRSSPPLFRPREQCVSDLLFCVHATGSFCRPVGFPIYVCILYSFNDSDRRPPSSGEKTVFHFKTMCRDDYETKYKLLRIELLETITVILTI